MVQSKVKIMGFNEETLDIGTRKRETSKGWWQTQGLAIVESHHPILFQKQRGEGISSTGIQCDTGGHLRICGLKNRNAATANPRSGSGGARGINAPTLLSPASTFHWPQRPDPTRSWGQRRPVIKSSRWISWGTKKGWKESTVSPEGKHSLYSILFISEGQNVTLRAILGVNSINIIPCCEVPDTPTLWGEEVLWKWRMKLLLLPLCQMGNWVCALISYNMSAILREIRKGRKEWSAYLKNQTYINCFLHQVRN